MARLKEERATKNPYKAIVFDYDGVMTTRLSDMLMPHKYPLYKGLLGLLINPDMRNIVLELKKRGYRMILLSNTIWPLAILRRRLGYYNEFEKVFLSYEIKARKPKSRAFEIMLQRTGLKPEEVLFIDDRGRNTDVAASLGMDVLQAKNYLQASAEIRKLTGIN